MGGRLEFNSSASVARRVIGRLGLGVEGILDSPLPAPLDGLTLYARFGDWILLALLMVGVCLARLAARA